MATRADPTDISLPKTIFERFSETHAQFLDILRGQLVERTFIFIATASATPISITY
jgi:hypothetical protein